MRLIDADALKQECMYIDDIPAVTERDIDNAPTIDAIPVEWLEEWLTEPDARNHVECILSLWKWRKEHGALYEIQAERG